MRKLSTYLLTIAVMLWAVRPAVIAAGTGWLEWGGNESYGVSSDTVPSDGSEQEKGDNWLTPGTVPEGSDQDAPEENGEWLTPDLAPGKAPAEAPAAPASVEDGGAVINVTVPGSGEMVINPNRQTVDLGGNKVQDQLISEKLVFANNNDYPITVGVSLNVDTTKSGGVRLSSQPISADEQEKLAYLYAEFHNLTDSNGEPQWDAGYSAADYQLLASDSETTKDVLRLDAAADGTPTYGAYRLYGSLTENPAAGWHYGEALTVTVSFTFRAVEETGGEETQAETSEEAEADGETPEPAAQSDEIPVEPETEPEPEPAEIPDNAPEENDIQTDVPEEDAQAAPPEGKPAQESYAAQSNPDWMRPPT